MLRYKELFNPELNIATIQVVNLMFRRFMLLRFVGSTSLQPYSKSDVKRKSRKGKASFVYSHCTFCINLLG